MSQLSTISEPVAPVTTERPKKAILRGAFNILGPFLILAFVVVLFAVLMPEDLRETFFSLYNFKLILSNTVIVALGALGMTMIIVSGGIDLSVGSIIALTSVLAALMVSEGYSLFT